MHVLIERSISRCLIFDLHCFLLSRSFGSEPPHSGYTTGCQEIFHHRHHIVRAPKCRQKVLRGEIRERVRTIVRQVRKEMGVTIVRGVL